MRVAQRSQSFLFGVNEYAIDRVGDGFVEGIAVDEWQLHHRSNSLETAIIIYLDGLEIRTAEPHLTSRDEAQVKLKLQAAQ